MIRTQALYDSATRNVVFDCGGNVFFEMRSSQARENITDRAIRRLEAKPDEWLTVYRPREGIRLT